ncbi:MAG: hypothetical protein KC800_18135 [Candidatus Eremiobacteraeota bacterium]|nr:hypothetical protein [Candidatus Eremiobacteraeota bacterium]
MHTRPDLMREEVRADLLQPPFSSLSESLFQESVVQSQACHGDGGITRPGLAGIGIQVGSVGLQSLVQGLAHFLKLLLFRAAPIECHDPPA